LSKALLTTTCISNCSVCAYSEIPIGISSGSFSFVNLVLSNATSHTQTRCQQLKPYALKREYLLFIITFLCYIPIYSQNQEESLNSFGWCQEIELSQTDDKCGEWGGDTQIIRIYKMECKGIVLADFKQIIVNCTDPNSENSKSKTIVKTAIELTISEKQLVEDCIAELTAHKKTSEKHIIHSGNLNTVKFKDPTLIIEDWSRFHWPKFQELSKTINNK